MMRTTARPAILGALLIFLCISFSGCYTVLKRPGAVMPEEDSYQGEGYTAEHWVHPDYVWYDPFYHWYYPDAYGHWRYYYTYPWWWNSYWFWDSGPGQPGAPVNTDRYIWDDRRRPDWSSPPSSPAAPSTASQPKGEKKENTKPPENSRKDQLRRKPDWNNEQDDRSDTDLDQKKRQPDEEGEGGQ